jgi:hypothetical protein
MGERNLSPRMKEGIMKPVFEKRQVPVLSAKVV